MKKLFSILCISSLVFASCSDDDNNSGQTPDPQPIIDYTSGSADFTTYVALGNSLTSGYSDNALFIDAQIASYPNMLAEKMALAGGGAFKLPLMSDNLGGYTIGGQSPSNNRLFFDLNTLTPTEVEGTGTTEITNNIYASEGPFNNLGIPGATSFHLLAPGYGDAANLALGAANPYFVRMASTPGTTVVADAVAQDPTFFSLWIGANDVLGYASSGAVNDALVTDQTAFAGYMDAILGQLTANGAKGVIANVPAIFETALFRTVPYNALSPDNPDFGPQIPVLNATFADLNAAFDFLGYSDRKIIFSETEASPMVVFDEDLINITQQLNAVLVGGGLDAGTAAVLSSQFGQSRQAQETDYISLANSGSIAALDEEHFTNLVTIGVPADLAGQLSVIGVTLPMEDSLVVTADEQDFINAIIDGYNTTIANLATNYDIALVDSFSLLTELNQNGIMDSGILTTGEFVFGGGFSLDGIHPSPRGYAITANEFIRVINEKYGSNLPMVDSSAYLPIYYE